MKISVTIVRIVVGILFIFSGLVKANDPLGLGYKMQEFFEIWNTGLAGGNFFLKNILISLFDFLHGHTLFLSVVIIAFEIIAGAALLLGWRMKLFIWLLLILILFFTFLTAYAFLSKHPDGSPKFTNCGCFGDCIPITPQTSFLKDIALTVLIGFLFIKRKWIRPVLRPGVSTAIMLGVTIFSLGIQWYALNYLPFIDCLPYKKGKNISEQMKIPPNAIPDSTIITYVYEKAGQTVEFTATEFPDDFNDSTYTFRKRYDKLVRKGKNNTPPISGFVLSGITGEDSTAVVLSQPYAILLYCENFSVPMTEWEDDFKKLYTETQKKNIPVYVITGQMDEAVSHFSGSPFTDVQLFTCDNTAIRTAARTNPCVYMLKQGTIVDKQSYKRMDRITDHIQAVPVQDIPKPVMDTMPVPDTVIK